MATHQVLHPSLAGPNASASWLSALILAVSIFVPGHMFGWAVEWAWLASLLAVGGLLVLNRQGIGAVLGVPTSLWLLIHALLTAASVISTGLALWRHNVGLETRDVAELLRFPIYGVFGTIVAALAANWSIDAVDRVLRWLPWFVLVCTAAFIQEIPLIHDAVTYIYAEAKVLVGLGIIRVPFPFENPNFLGFFAVMALIYFIFYRPSLVHITLLTVVLFVTGSRSAWIAALPAFILGGIVVLWRYSLLKLGWRTVATWLTPAAAIILIVVYWSELTYFSRLAELAAAFQGRRGVETAEVRFVLAGDLLGWFERSPVWGWGPGRTLGLDVADNQYVSWLVNWGIAGTTLVIAANLLLLGRLILAASRIPEFAGAVALTASLALMIFTGDFLENYRLYFLMLMMLQACYAISQTSAALPDAGNRFHNSRERKSEQKARDGTSGND